ncbi:putative RNA-directed DNA polymerase [Tanacetum coccineum]
MELQLNRVNSTQDNQRKLRTYPRPTRDLEAEDDIIKEDSWFNSVRVDGYTRISSTLKDLMGSVVTSLRRCGISARGDDSLILSGGVFNVLRFAWSTNSLHRSFNISASLSHKNGKFYFSFKFGISGLLHQWGKCCVKNYSSVRRYIADPDNAYPKRSITKLILKGAVIFDVVSYQFRCALNYSKLVRAIYRTEVCAGAIYPNKVVSEPGYDKQWQKTWTDRADGMTEGRKQNRSRSKSKKRGQSKNRQDITCWNCNQKGHFQNQCSKPVTSRDKEVNMAAGDYDDALVCCVENTIDDRIMDSGASFHATYCKEELERFKLRSGKVRLADDKTLDIAGVGDVVLKTSFDTSWTLKDVRYIPGLKKRLNFVGQLDEEGYYVGFGDQQWKVTKGSLVVARGNKRGSLYLVKVPSNRINAAIDGRGNATLWHQRLEHMSEKGMKILASKGRIPDLQKAVVGFCEPCVLGKQKKVSFVKSRNTRKLQRLELVHTDVYDPTSVASIGGSRYYVTFIDDSSKKVWVYFLKNKSEVFNTFKKWKAAVENETNLRNGIRMLKTVSETPQQNGVAERMNQTLNERAKKEEWQGKEVSLAHLRGFGCDSYVKVKDVARDKLDAKSVKCTFVGYGSDEMGYRFWDSKSYKVVRSRDVTFNEDSLYGAKVVIYSSNLTKPNQKDQVVLVDSPENLANKSIVSEHGLSSKITQSPGGSSDMGEGSENSGSFKNSGRSDEEDSEDRASFEDGGFETPQLQRSIRESRAPVRYSPSANYLLLTENGEPESYSEALSSKEFVQWKKAINEEMVSLEKNQTWSLVKLPAGKKALQSKWVFRVKEEQDGKKKYKGRLVVKSF